MRIRTLTLATTISLLGSTALVPEALAQKGISLKPQTSWATKKVNTGTPSEYCAVARRFDKNLILTIAKNPSQETSVALDFGKGDFDTTKRYKLTLDPGAGGQRAFNAKPTSNKAFVLRVGRDQKFINSLEKTGFMRIELDGKTYNLDIADIDIGKEQLNTCLVSSVQPAAGNENMLPAPSSSPMISSLKKQKKNLESKLQKLESENKSLKIALKSSGQDQRSGNVENSFVKSLQKQIDTLKQQNQNLQALAEKNDLSDVNSQDVSVVALARENQKLRQLIDGQQDNSATQEQIKTLSDKVSVLENENMSLSRRLNEAGSAKADEVLAQQLMALKSENKALRQSLDNENIAQENFAELRQSVQKLEQDKLALNGRIHNLLEEKKSIVKQLDFYEDENKSLQNKLIKEDDTALLSQLRREIQSMESQNAQALSTKELQIQTLERDIVRLKTDKSRLMASKESEERQVSKEFEAKTEAMRIKNEALRAELVEISKAQVSIDNLKSKVTQLEEEKLLISYKLSDAEINAQKLSTSLENAELNSDSIKVLNEEIASLGQKVRTLETKNADLQNKLSSEAQKEKLDVEKLASLKVDIKTLKEENEFLHGQASSLKEEKDTLTQQVSLLEDEKGFLAQKLENQNKNQDLNSQTVASLQKEIEQLSSDNKRLRDDILSVSSEKEMVNEELSNALETNERFEEKLAASNNAQLEKISSLEQLLQTLEEQNQKLKAEWSEKEKALNQEIISLGDEKGQLSEEVAELEAQRNETLEGDAALKVEVTSLQEKNTELLNTVERLKMQKDLAVKTLKEKMAEKVSIKNEEIFVSKQKIEDFETQNTSLLEEKTKLEAENKDLRLSLENASEFNEMLQSDWQSTLVKLEQLQIENAQYVEDITVSESDVNENQKLQKVNAELLQRLDKQTKEFLVLVREYENLKRAKISNIQNVSLEKVKEESSRVISKLQSENSALQQEVLKLRQSVKAQQKPVYREASLDTTKVKPKSISNSKKAPEIAEKIVEVQKGAPASLTQEQQATANIETLNSKAQTLANNERETISKLVEIEPAAGPLQEDIMNLTEAQRMERRLKEEVSLQQEPMTEKVQDVETELAILKDVEVVSKNEDKQDRQNKASSRNIAKVKSSNIESILSNSGIQMISAVERVNEASDNSRKMYQWQTAGSVYGSAQQKPMNSGSEFDNYVRDYLTTTENRCAGDFAIIPASTQETGGVRIDSYEIACVGQGVDSSASLVFFSKDGVFTALAHEAPTNAMDMTMEARDKIISTVQRS